MSLAINSEQSAEIRQKLEERFSDETDELKGLTKLILTFASEFFTNAQGLSFRIFFSQKPLADHAAYCKRLEASIRFKLKVDFFILIDKELFEGSNRIQKAKLIIHELHHMGKDEKGNPIIWKHNEKESFCELPSHDVFSDNVVKKIRDRLALPALEAEVVA